MFPALTSPANNVCKRLTTRISKFWLLSLNNALKLKLIIFKFKNIKIYIRLPLKGTEKFAVRDYLSLYIVYSFSFDPNFPRNCLKYSFSFFGSQKALLSAFFWANFRKIIEKFLICTK